jgi:3-oxoacid CoA-transferase
MVGGGIGGAMDLAVGGRRVIVMLEHTDSQGRPKLVERCQFPLTARACVDTVVTDLAVLHREGDHFRLAEIAPGFTVEEVRSLTEMAVTVADPVGTM